MTKVIIIEAGPGSRRLDPRQSSPRSLVPVAEGQHSSLEWTLRALKQSAITDITYVGGYHIEKVIEAFPEFSFRYLRGNLQKAELGRLLDFGESENLRLVVEASTVLLPAAVALLRAGGACAGTYRSKDGRKRVGAYALDRVAVEALLSPADTPFDGLLAVEEAIDRAVTREVILDGLAAPANDKIAVAAMILSGKARALDSLAPLLKEARVLDLVRFSAARWKEKRETVLSTIQARFGDASVVIRSSTVAEDSFNASAAGRFLSVLDVSATNAAGLERAIDDVIASFASCGRNADPDDEVLVQPYVRDLTASGVLLTRDPQHGSPYFVLNLDAGSGRSDLVTSGGAGAIETSYLAWGAEDRVALERGRRQILEASRELIRLSHFDALDIEFGLSENDECYLFQVRPLTCVEPTDVDSDEDILDVVTHLHAFVEEASRPRPGVLGQGNLLGNMSDWNPAEMIGVYPRPLALSLYQTLVGDHAWAQARARLGYRDMTAVPLILSLGGRPYVDIRASLNSFLPADLDEAIGVRWIDHCLEKLRNDPPLHDKIEFELAVTCLTPEWARHEEWLADAGLTKEERRQFRECLRRLTAPMIGGQTEPIARQFSAIEQLGVRREQVLSTSSETISGLGRRLRQLVLDCARLGVVPFSITARYAFVSLALLKGLRYAGEIGDDLHESFLRAVPTVSGRFAQDSGRLARNEIDVAEMVSRYGHLRPHSYDITSRNYAAHPEHYFRPGGSSFACKDAGESADPVGLLLGNKRGIETALAGDGLNLDAGTLARFMSEAITGRERAKFEFMKSVNAILETVAGIGRLVGLSREELSFVPLAEFMSLESNSTSRVLESHLRRVSGQNEKRWLLGKALRLPDLITRPDDVYVHRLESWRPNFVTRKKVVAAPVLMNGMGTFPNLDGAIVFIRAADPGFDWIFGHSIAGLVTQYGGVASHMAIRAAEFGLPAAIGCGESLFEKLSRARLVELDCEHRTIRSVS